MLLLYILLVIHTVFTHELNYKEKVYYKEEDAAFYFQMFINTHYKNYSETEREMRFKVFKDNLVKLNELNKADPYCSFVINQFTDLSTEEFIQKHTGLRVELEDASETCKVVGDSAFVKQAPNAFDWRTRINLLVRNQGICGSCFACSATGNVEAQYAIKYNRSISLSVQQIVDCDTLDVGCDGGYPTNALRYLIQAGGQALETDYPYVDRTEVCHFMPSTALVRLVDCTTFHLTNEDMIKEALYRVGPLSVVVDATSLQSYRTGILQNCIYTNYNHVVLLVGYGTSADGQDFWVIKNSWGRLWGEAGYGKIRRGVNACGILNTYISSAIVE